jgi:CRP-like cAMP-binding protein
MAVDAARIRDVPLFAELGEDEREAIADKLSERRVGVGHHLSTEGGAGYFFFVIESGTATVAHGDDVVATLGPGDFLGEAAVLESTRRTATVTAATDMVVLEMFGADFAMLHAHSPAVKATIDRAMSERLPKG